MELIKDNIEYEQLLGTNTVDTVVRQEFIIPDTHPDVQEILMVEAKPSVNSREIMQNKIYIEGSIEYNVMYLSNGEKSKEVFNVIYSGKFANNLEIKGAQRDMMCEIESYVEHMDCYIANERKISVEGIIQLKASVYKNYSFDIVKDITDDDRIELLKNPASVDKIAAVIPSELIGKCHMQIPMDYPEISEVLKCDVNLHKEEIKVYDGKMKIEAMAKIKFLYKNKDSREINVLDDDILLSKDIEDEGIKSDMDNYTDFVLDAIQVDVKEDDLGEKRNIDIDILVKTNTKLMYKEEIDMIEDAYSPEQVLDITKKNYSMNVVHGTTYTETLVKGDIAIDDDMPKVKEIILCDGAVCITDKKLVEDKIVIEGVVDTKILYRSEDEENYICNIEDSLPFNCSIDMTGAKIDMNCFVKARLESIETTIEPGNIAVKSVVNLYARVNYATNKDFIIDIQVNEDEIPKKKASITIYVVQNGDTLWKIAKNYNSKLEDLAKVNDIEDINSIKVGDKLIIPGRAII